MSRRGPWLPARAARTAKRVGIVTLVLGSVVLPSSYAAFSSTDFARGSLTAASSFYGSDVLSDGPAGYWRLDGPSVADCGGQPRRHHRRYGHQRPGRDPRRRHRGADHHGRQPAAALDREWRRLGRALLQGRGRHGTSGSNSSWPSVSPIVSTWTQSADGDFGIGLDSGGDLVAGMGTSGTDATIASTGTNYKDGAWHHLVWTRDSTTGLMSLYADGALVASGSGSTVPLTARATLSLGVVPWFAPTSSIAGALDVSIDDVATYPSVLGAAQVAVHNTARTGGYPAAVAADSPAGYWRLDDAAGTTAAATVGAAGSYLGSVTHAVTGAVAG